MISLKKTALKIKIVQEKDSVYTLWGVHTFGLVFVTSWYIESLNKSSDFQSRN
jgi:hypothetical protein